ncbi:MAG: chloride channel protein [Marinilabiliales bacterium]|nr:MAG: chloride channel protein [Marinilabiliales bacterium]
MYKSKNLIKFIRWRANNISDRFFLILLSIIIGLLSGLAAFVLKKTVYNIEDLLFSYFDPNDQIYIFLFLPMVGIILTIIFIRYIIRDNVKHGVPRILYSISKLDGSMKRHKVFSSIIGGSLTAGFGGSIGLESPIISTGASIGSTLGQIFRLSYKHKTLLIGCGVSGAMASIFTTPIAAVIFGFEVLLLDLGTASLIPLLIASVTGAVTTKMLLSEQFLVHFKVTQQFIISDIPFFIILGIATGFIAVYFHWAHFKIIRVFSNFKSIWLKAAIGGLLLGLLIFIFPPLYSEGYDSIRMIVSGNANQLMDHTFFSNNESIYVLVGFTIFLMLTKVLAASFTSEAGGIGGIFAPAAVMGGFGGFALSRLLNDVFPSLDLHEGNFTLIGMGSVLGGVLQAPLTAIFLIAEMSNGYEIIVPLMLSTSIAFLIARKFNKHSIFHSQLLAQGLFVHYRDKSVLKNMKISDLVEKNVQTIKVDETLGSLIELVKTAKRNIFAVVDYNETFIGIISLEEIRKDMFDKEKYDEPVTNYLYQMLEDEKVELYSEIPEVINKFNNTGNYNLIVVNGKKYIGVISKANTLKAYRDNLLQDETEDKG